MALQRVGLQKTSLVDFPGEVAATVFTPGCNLRCPYCHNASLVFLPFPPDLISLEELTRFLDRRAGVLGGVCITGGEPLLHPDLPELIGLLHRRGLKVKLDTNGTCPGRLAAAEVEYVALDLKTVPERYRQLLPRAGGEPAADVHAAGSGAGDGTADWDPGEAVRESVQRLRRGAVPYELRSTVVPGLFGPAELRGILPLLSGAERYVLQPFRASATLDPAWSSAPEPAPKMMEELREIAAESGVETVLADARQPNWWSRGP